MGDAFTMTLHHGDPLAVVLDTGGAGRRWASAVSGAG